MSFLYTPFLGKRHVTSSALTTRAYYVCGFYAADVLVTLRIFRPSHPCILVILRSLSTPTLTYSTGNTTYEAPHVLTTRARRLVMTAYFGPSHAYVLGMLRTLSPHALITCW